MRSAPCCVPMRIFSVDGSKKQRATPFLDKDLTTISCREPAGCVLCCSTSCTLPNQHPPYQTLFFFSPPRISLQSTNKYTGIHIHNTKSRVVAVVCSNFSCVKNSITSDQFWPSNNTKIKTNNKRKGSKSFLEQKVVANLPDDDYGIQIDFGVIDNIVGST